jgi:hypothetical protein
MSRRAFSFALLAALVPLVGLAQDAPPAGEDVQAVQAYLDGLLAHDRAAMQVGTMSVNVSVVPDYFMVLAAREYVRLEGREVASVLQRLADRQKKTIGRVGVLLRFHHARGNDGDFYAFQGQLDDHLRITAMANIAMVPARVEGPIETVELTLFKANRSPAFAAEGQCPPVMRRTMNRFTDDPVEVDFVARRALSERAEAIELQLGGFLHISGRGISGHQIDFENGATAVNESSPEQSFPLPLRVPPVPPALAAVMPTLRD